MNDICEKKLCFVSLILNKKICRILVVDCLKITKEHDSMTLRAFESVIAFFDADLFMVHESTQNSIVTACLNSSAGCCVT